MRGTAFKVRPFLPIVLAGDSALGNRELSSLALASYFSGIQQDRKASAIAVLLPGRCAVAWSLV